MAQRGRPRKTPIVAEAAAENSSATTMTGGDELAAMKEQVAYQLAQLLKTAEKMGVDLATVFPAPPKEVTKVESPEAVAPATGTDGTITINGQSFKITPQSTNVPAPSGTPKPGQYLPGGAWVQWTKNDLDPNETITFVPMPIPGMVYPFPDENGYQKIKLDVNGLVCWLTVGAENTINKFFYNVYKAALENHRELEAFKRNGPSYAPWGAKAPDGGPAWRYIPMAASFGMNIDGHSLRIGGPTPLDLTPSEAAAAPADSGTGSQS
jgi:hypothetical protein